MTQPASESTSSTSRRGIFLAGLGVFVVIVLIALAVFQPWKLFVDESVDEALPAGARPATAAPATGATAPPTSASTSPSTSPSTTGSPGASSPVATAVRDEPSTTTAPPAAPSGGPFKTYEHETSGTASVVTADGRKFVRFEDFKTSNGPDVVVYLSPAPPSGPEGAFEKDFVDLGALKGNVGNQNYEIPAGTDLSKYKSVVIWCRRFHVAFAAAPV